MRRMNRLLSIYRSNHSFILGSRSTYWPAASASTHSPASQSQALTFSTTMSWMDSWSRPGKSQPVPPPYYLTSPQTKYCHSCGRIISDRKSHKAAEATSTPPKYCSSRCRSHKPREKDRRFEAAFLALLNGETEFEGEEIPKAVLDARQKPKAKGEKRLTIPCSAVEMLIYGDRSDPTKVFGRRKNRASRAIATPDDSDVEEATLVYHVEDGDGPAPTAFAGKVRPPQHLTSVNGSIGGEKGRAEREVESAEAAGKRIEGQKMADEKEGIKRAARRLCIFGLEERAAEEKRMCEAVMGGTIVEPSFAKGDWGVRWRE
ncbi:hypothetical protein NLU13_9715 [Sarocladium strictum]|uniref:Uncharacterized protein n=1 Tax=Sarocladium strictum TaxID=5046 RepID=A0AA39GB94_SARSR|nr:hypothetical protein NLU13_9715 [Sarocladium strictum]